MLIGTCLYRQFIAFFAELKLFFLDKRKLEIQ